MTWTRQADPRKKLRAITNENNYVSLYRWKLVAVYSWACKCKVTQTWLFIIVRSYLRSSYLVDYLHVVSVDQTKQTYYSLPVRRKLREPNVYYTIAFILRVVFCLNGNSPTVSTSTKTSSEPAVTWAKSHWVGRQCSRVKPSNPGRAHRAASPLNSSRYQLCFRNLRAL